MAWSQYRAGNYDEAADTYRTLITSYPDSDLAGEAKFRIGECYFVQGKYVEAIAEYEKKLASFPEDTFSSESQYRIAESYEKLGNKELAVEAFQKTLREYPQSIAAARIHLREGISYEEKKDYKKAIEKYRLATNLARNEVGAEAQKRIGDCYYFRKDYHNAVVEYLKVVYLYNKYPYFAAPAQYMAGESNGKQRFWEEARKAYKKVIENYPETEWAKKAKTELELIADK